jgi:hypothetical protein
MKNELSGILVRLRRLVPKIQKEEARRQRFDKWLRSIMKSGLGGASESEIKAVLSKRYGLRAPKPAKKTPPKRTPPKRTREHERRLKLQGKYIAAVRNLKAVDKARVKAVLAKDGVRPAIALGKQLMSEVK